MQKPSAIWLGLNVFRLVAVVFVSWAIAAQFLLMASEIRSLQDATLPVPVTATAASTSIPTNTITSWAVAGSLTVSPQSFSSTSHPSPRSSQTIDAASTASSRAPRTSTPVSEPAATSRVISDLEGEFAPLMPDRKPGWRRRDGVELDKREEAVSFQPGTVGQRYVRGDTIIWVALSRIMIAALLFVCLCAQLGIPEHWLYTQASWLGPQSTPVSLGALQSFCAIEALRIGGETVNLIPLYALLGIGLLNALGGSGLLLLARKLPKDPPPPLYFNHSQRLLFWRPLPPFYHRLFHPDLPLHRAASHTSTASQAEKDLPPINALELGLDTDDDEVAVTASEEKEEPSRMIRGASTLTADQDVSRGGYPTFGGSGIGEPGRNVPSGWVERAGKEVRFVREEMQEQQEDSPAHPVIGQGESNPSKRPDRRKSLIPVPSKSREGLPDAGLNAKGLTQRSSERDSRRTSSKRNRAKDKAGPSSLEGPRPDLPRSESAGSNSSAYGGLVNSRPSHRKPAEHAIPDVPIPQIRPESTKGAENSGFQAEMKQSLSRLDTVVAPGRTPLSPAKTVLSPLSPRFRLPAARSRTSYLPYRQDAEKVHVPSPSEHKTPCTPRTALSTPSPVTAQITEARHGHMVPSHTIERQPSDTTAASSSTQEVEEVADSHEPASVAIAATKGAERRSRARSMAIAPSPVSATSDLKRSRSTIARPPKAARGVRFDLPVLEGQVSAI